jgi:hypothetical protein
MTRPTMAAVRELAGFKEPVLVATTANITLSGLQTIDGATMSAGNRVLVKNQTDATENGIYLASAGEWYRAPDAASSRNINKGVLVWVQGGAANANKVFYFSVLAPDLGTDNILLVEMDFGGSAGLSDAPSDSNQYARYNGTWVALDYATLADARAATAGLNIFTTELIETAAELVALTDAATVAVDWDSAINFSLTLGGNRTLGNPTNGQPGTWRTLVVTQDGTGSRTLAYDTNYKFSGGTEPVLTTAAASVDMLSIYCVSATNFFVFSAADMKA